MPQCSLKKKKKNLKRGRQRERPGEIGRIEDGKTIERQTDRYK